MRTLKTYESFHEINEEDRNVIGVNQSKHAKPITTKQGEGFITITQESSLGKKTNVIVVPDDIIKEFIRDLNSVHGYFVDSDEARANY
jgi:hypothetical protein